MGRFGPGTPGTLCFLNWNQECTRQSDGQTFASGFLCGRPFSFTDALPSTVQNRCTVLLQKHLIVCGRLRSFQIAPGDQRDRLRL